MVDVYNFYIGGYLPKVPAKSTIHKKSELKSIYNNIVNINKKSPLALVNLSQEKQAYALDVKEMAMVLKSSTSEVLNDENDDQTKQSALKETEETFNRLLRRSDEFASLNNKPSRPGGELRNLVHEYKSELEEAGFTVDELNYLSAPEESVSLPTIFLKALNKKSEYMSMNPIEYIDKKICSYGFLNNKNIGSSYGESMYSGMLFNFYC